MGCGLLCPSSLGSWGLKGQCRLCHSTLAVSAGFRWDQAPLAHVGPRWPSPSAHSKDPQEARTCLHSRLPVTHVRGHLSPEPLCHHLGGWCGRMLGEGTHTLVPRRAAGECQALLPKPRLPWPFCPQVLTPRHCGHRAASAPSALNRRARAAGRWPGARPAAPTHCRRPGWGGPGTLSLGMKWTEEAGAGPCLVFYFIKQALRGLGAPAAHVPVPTAPAGQPPLRLCHLKPPATFFSQVHTFRALSGTISVRHKGQLQSLASLCAQDRDATLVEAPRVLLRGDLEVHSEDQVCAGEVQVDRQGHLRERQRSLRGPERGGEVAAAGDVGGAS